MVCICYASHCCLLPRTGLGTQKTEVAEFQILHGEGCIGSNKVQPPPEKLVEAHAVDLLPSKPNKVGPYIDTTFGTVLGLGSNPSDGFAAEQSACGDTAGFLANEIALTKPALLQVSLVDVHLLDWARLLRLHPTSLGHSD